MPVRRRGRPRAWLPNPATAGEVSTDPPASNPATTPQVSTDPLGRLGSRQTSACALYREVVVQALARGRNAMAIWQDLVDGHGFRHGYASVRRFVRTLQAVTRVEPASSSPRRPAKRGRK